MNALKKFFAESSYYGKLMLLIGFLTAVPLAVVPFYPGEAQYIPAFLIPAAVSAALGLTVCFRTSRKEKQAAEWQSPLQKGSLPVLFAWCFAFLSGAVPFMIGGGLNFIHALFESVSGWTTTCLTVLKTAEIPHIFLFQRSFMPYCGGLGFIIMISVLAQGDHNMNLYSAEGHPDRIMPSLKSTAHIIFMLYNYFFIAGTLIYWLLGMKLFDAVCHTMTALSTAGFKMHALNIENYGSLPIELFTVLLMLAGSTNFAVLLLLVKGKFRRAARVSEFRFMLIILLVSVPLAAVSLMKNMGLGFGGSMINALFGIVSTLTTSGHSAVNYTLWPPFALGLIFALMFAGGSAGSTAGGIKLLRVYLLARFIKENIRGRISPAHRVTTPSYNRVQGKTLIDDALIKDTLGFVICYTGVFTVGTFLLTVTADSTLFDAMFAFASAFSTAGISNSLTSADLSAGSLLVLMGGMILGRLEIFIVFVGIYSGAQSLKRRFQNKTAKK